MAAVGVQQRLGQRSRIAQLARAAAQEVETETFDVSWGSEGWAGMNRDPSSSSGNSLLYWCARLCFCHPPCQSGLDVCIYVILLFVEALKLPCMMAFSKNACQWGSWVDVCSGEGPGAIIVHLPQSTL